MFGPAPARYDRSFPENDFCFAKYLSMNTHTLKSVSSAVKFEFDRAVKLHQSGALQAAEESYRELLVKEPDFAPCLHMLGVIFLQNDQLTEALEYVGQAISLDPSQAVFFNNYGAALHRLERHVEALACFHRAVAIRPQYIDALSNLGKVYEELGQLAPAAAYYREALELSPEHAEVKERYGTLAKQRGDSPEMIQLCEELLKHEPTAELHVRMGNFLISRGKAADAATHYEKALAIEPTCAPALFNLANSLQEQHRIPESKEMFTRAAEARPKQPFWRLRVHATCPVIWENSQAIDDYCGELSTELDRWLTDRPPARAQELVNAGAFPNFSFAYLGRNVRELKEKFGALYAHYFQERSAPQGSGLKDKLRLGIVVTQRHEGIFLRCLAGILQHLSREQFEVVVCCPTASLTQIRDGLNLESLRYVTFPQALEEAARLIRGAACDIMYYWEVGSDSLNYFLPFCRLAPVQCTSHGSQITSGHPSIGHFFSSQAMELPTAAGHYTERLWKAQSLLMHQTRLPTLVTRSREHFGLPAKHNLYMCLQNPLKLHPDFDPILQQILDTDPQGTIVLLRGGQPAAEELLRKRFQRVMPDVAPRIQLLPHQPFPDYLALLNLADVLLDPLYFGWGSSAYDVFSFNQPLVTFPTELNVGRVATACYERMGIRDLITQSAVDYVAIATRLGKEPEFRNDIRQRLAAASEVLFNERLAVSEHEHFFLEIANRAERQ